MSAHIFRRSAFGIAAAAIVLTGCSSAGSPITAGPSLPVAAQFTMNFTNSVVYNSTQSGVSFSVVDATRSCIQFPQPFSDDDLSYNASTQRIVQLVDCGTSGWFTVKFHALDVPLADTTVRWTVSESGASESIDTQGGLCIHQTGGTLLQDVITAKPASGCP